MADFDAKKLEDSDGNGLNLTPTHFLDAQGGKHSIEVEFGKMQNTISTEDDNSDIADNTVLAKTLANNKLKTTLAVRLWNYIKGKANSVYAALSHTHKKSQIIDFSHSHNTSDINGLDNTLNGIGSSIGTINAELEHKASDTHTHSTLVDHESNSGSVALGWSGASISSVTPTGSNTKASSKYLVAIYLDNGVPVFKDVQAGNVKVGNADKVDDYHIVVGSVGSDANTIYLY